VPSPTPVAAPAKPNVTTATAEAAWKHAVEAFAAKNPLEADTIRAVVFHTVKADQIEVLIPTSLEKKIHYLRSPRNLEVLERALDEKLGTKVSIVYKIADPANAVAPVAPTPAVPTAPGKPAPPAPSLTPETFANDPVIQNALKLFEAKIVGRA
jgi:hypothetical protein